MNIAIVMIITILMEYQLLGYHAINGERVSVTWISCY